MSDKFEEWLETEIKNSRDMLDITSDRFDDGIEQGYANSLAKYREFLKEQRKPKTNSELALELEKIETMLLHRHLMEEAETLRTVAARLK